MKNQGKIGKWFYAQYGPQVICGLCVAEHPQGLVLKFRWGHMVRMPYFIENHRLISEALDPRWSTAIINWFKK